MALIIPKFIPSRASHKEKFLYEIISKNFNDNFFVWYKPINPDGFPTFIILSPSFGLLFLDVKGWYPHQIIHADRQNLTIKFQKERHEEIDINKIQNDLSGRRIRKRSRDNAETTELKTSPLQLSKIYLEELLCKLKQYQILTYTDEYGQRKLAFPVGFGVVMSNMTAQQAREKNIYDILSEHQVICREELLSWASLGQAELVNRLGKVFTDKFPFLNLTSDQVETIKGILHPEIAITELPASYTSIHNGVELPNQSYVIKTLDHRQECIARNIGDGHRIIYGVAGSGKTLILISQAKLLANQNNIKRILILCFNRSLAAHLKSILHEDTDNPHFQQKIEAFSFHSWVYSEVKRLPKGSGFSMEYYDELIGEMLLKKLRYLPRERKWDAVLVDEAQTFYPSWFKCCVAALKDPENGNLMIVADGNQSLYKRQGFTWKSVGIKAIGRTSNKKLKLDKNYRNTEEILAAAWSLVSHIPNQEIARNIDEADVTTNIIKPRAASRQGLLPVLHIEKTENHEIEAVIREIQELHKVGYSLNHIAVLYRTAFSDKFLLINTMIQRLYSLDIDSYWVSKTRESEKKYSRKTPGIRIISTLNSIGLEFKVVLVLWVQDWEFRIPAISESDVLTCRRLYVAMTRAQDILHVFGSGSSNLIKELQKSGRFEIKQG